MPSIVPENIEQYMRSLASRHDEPVLLEMETHASVNGFPIVGRLCGLTIEVLARSIGARRVFEMGSGFGYSAYWFARATGPGGEIHLTDGDPDNESLARGYLTRAGVWDRISYHVGDALTHFGQAEGDFDIVYCDVDKAGYPDCWRAARDRIRVGGMWICDNVLWSGRVLDDDPDDSTAGIQSHNELVAGDPRYLSTVVPTRDGLMVALRVAS
ncbi:MAG TPA: O-methyltransferase [Actinomycetota bacterium]|nr:O-methyltransferase [Actinomycetota bacterium]